MSDEGNTPGQKASPWLKRGLILSLALNLLLAGLLAGAFARSHMLMMRPGGTGFGPLGMALSREDRRALRDRFAGNGQDWKAFRAAGERDFADLATIIAADPFDRSAAAAILDRQAGALAQRMAAARGLLLDRIAAMAPAERTAFADRLRAALRARD